MSRGGASSRVSIPDNVRKTIQDIKEVTGKHSEEDIYAMLKECSMEPNETIDRLLYLDTFHEVKSKRDKRKENSNSRTPEDSLRRKPGFQGRGARGGRGYPPYTSHGSGGGRNAIQKENGVNGNKERVIRPPPTSLTKEADAKVLPVPEKSTSSAVNGMWKVPNSWTETRGSNQPPAEASTNLAEDGTDSDMIMPKSLLPYSGAHMEHAPSSSNPVVVSSQLSPSVGAIEYEVQNQRAATESCVSLPADEGVNACPELVELIQASQHAPQGAEDAITKGAIEYAIMAQSMRVSEPISIEKNQPSKKSLLSTHPVHAQSFGVNSSSQQLISSSGGSSRDFRKNPTSALPTDATSQSEPTQIQLEQSSQLAAPKSPLTDDAALKLERLKFSDGQHVIIPNHIQVPDAVKSILSFGSLDASFVDGINLLKDSETSKDSSNGADLNEKTVEESSLREDASSVIQDDHYTDQPQAPSHLLEEVSLPESQITSDAVLSDPIPSDSQLKHEELPAIGPPYPVVPNPPSYGFGFLPHMLGSPVAQLDGLESQARVSSSMSENSQAMTTSASMSPAAPSPGVVQSTISLAPPLPLFRQPYPHSYIPYSHYYSPFYMPPALPQYFGHSGFPPQLPTGNMYLQQPGAASGVKVSPATYKPGSNTGNAAHVGMPSGYGVYSSLPLGYGPSTAVASGNSNGNEELVVSLKDANVYPGQQSEGPPVWIPAPGRETSSIPVNSFFNLPPQGPHVTVPPQAGHAAFTAIYSPLQTIPNPATGHPLLQQSQPLPVAPESGGAPPQRQSINWNSGF